MQPIRSTWWLAAALLALAGALTGAPAAGATATAPRPPAVAVAPDALEWQPVPLLAGMTFARVWGAADGPQARLVRIGAGGRLPLHVHTANVRVVVVSGTYLYAVRGEPERPYPAGSFILTPGGVPHVAGCSDACLYYEELDGAPDFVPVR